MYVLTTSPRKFIPTQFKDSDAPLTFTVVPPNRKTNLQMQELIMQNLDDKEEISSLPLEKLMNLYFDNSVTGWENIGDEEGKPMPFTKENFESFSDLVILTELYSFIKELSESTEKN